MGVLQIGILAFFESTNTLPWENPNYGNPSVGLKGFGRNVLPSFNFKTDTAVGSITSFIAKKVNWKSSAWSDEVSEETLNTTKIVVESGTANDNIYHIADYALGTNLTSGYWQLEIKTATRTWVSDIFCVKNFDDTPQGGSSFTDSFTNSFY